MKRKTIYIILVLVIFNFTVLWFFTHNNLNETNTNYTSEERLDVTIVIPTIEHYDNDISATVKHISKYYHGILILVLSDGIPYPYPKITSRNVKFIYKRNDPSIPWHLSDTLKYIKTKYVFVMPDGSRKVEANAIEKLVWTLRTLKSAHILSSSISNDYVKCKSIDIDLKLWTLKYTKLESGGDSVSTCDYVESDAILLFETRIFSNFSEIFVQPFYESFFIQAKINKLQISFTKDVYFTRGKFLFTDNHNKWKHQTKLSKQTVAMYKRFGVKRLITASGKEKWFGCSKNTVRCFPSVVDIPYYLYQGRWTPPCCLNALRTTAKHVFFTLEYYGIVYWLEGGSLLGAARHGDIIPWDYDVDIGMFVNETDKMPFLKHVWTDHKKVVDKDGFVWERATEGDFIRVQYSVTNHLHVDIFPFYEKNGVMTKNTWFKTHRQDMEFPARFLKPIERLMFVGVNAMVPNNYKEFLEFKFGKGVIKNPQYPFPEKMLGIDM